MVLRYLVSKKHKLNVRLACVKHLDSVQSEPSPNSSIKITFLIENAKTFIQFFVYKVMQFTFTKLLSNSLPYGTTLYLNNLFLIINYTSY